MNGWQRIVGHEWAVETLQTALGSGHAGHAYLITGPSQIGKTTLALTVAQALNCTAEDQNQRPCGRCRSCTLIAAGRHPDVRLITGEPSGRGNLTIKIDQIRDLQRELNLTATEARHKIAILRQFETANASAANAFLKTLEEPPSHVILLLTASDADTLLPTITSRCRIIGLRPLPGAQVTEALIERWQVEPDQARLLAHLADGRLGWAVQAAQDETLVAERSERLNILERTLAETRVGRFAVAATLANTPDTLPELLRLWLSWWRDLTLLIYGQQEPEAISNLDCETELQLHAQEWTSQQALHSLQRTEQAIWQLEHNANARLVLENLLLVYPYSSTAPASLVRETGRGVVIT
jgi:DNA polymerase-3 subunit delta'